MKLLKWERSLKQYSSNFEENVSENFKTFLGSPDFLGISFITILLILLSRYMEQITIKTQETRSLKTPERTFMFFLFTTLNNFYRLEEVTQFPLEQTFCKNFAADLNIGFSIAVRFIFKVFGSISFDFQ